DYGFALPNDVELFVLMGEGGHDDHDDHDDHSDEGDDHDDHSDEGDDHDDDDGEIHADEDEEVFMYDPHSWLSPLAFEAQLAVVLDSLVLNFPNGTNIFNTNAVAYSAQLQALDNGFNDAFGDSGDCDTAGVTKTIIANHNAYSYMTLKYDIEVVSLHGLDPEGEPSPEDIAEVVDHINEEGITVLFVEEFTDQGAVDSIVQQTGVSIQILYTMELSPSDANDNYLSLMNKNLESLISGIGC
ncbi:TPA: zinc ABC transporter substrate-binding protein, partial [Candidatus Thalassarchaeaceae archaeon]